MTDKLIPKLTQDTYTRPIHYVVTHDWGEPYYKIAVYYHGGYVLRIESLDASNYRLFIMDATWADVDANEMVIVERQLA